MEPVFGMKTRIMCMYIHHNVVLVRGHTLRSYRGNMMNVCLCTAYYTFVVVSLVNVETRLMCARALVCVYLFTHVCMLYRRISVRRLFT